VLFRADYTIYTLPIFDRVRFRVRVWCNVQIKYSNSTIYNNSLSAGWLVRELSSSRSGVYPEGALGACAPQDE